MYLNRLMKCLVIMTLITQVTLESSGYTGENRGRLLRFLSLISGFYTSNDTVNAGETKIVLPVETTAFGQSLAFYIEEGSERQLLVLGERPDGYIGIKFYNFTGSDDIKGDIDVSIFQKLHRSDYTTLPNCESVVTEIEDRYMMNWPECDAISDGLLPSFMTIWTCHLNSYISYKNPQPDWPKNLPVFMYKTKSYPLPPSMLDGVENFTEPCADQDDNDNTPSLQ